MGPREAENPPRNSGKPQIPGRPSRLAPDRDADHLSRQGSAWLACAPGLSPRRAITSRDRERSFGLEAGRGPRHNGHMVVPDRSRAGGTLPSRQREACHAYGCIKTRGGSTWRCPALTGCWVCPTKGVLETCMWSFSRVRSILSSRCSFVASRTAPSRVLATTLPQGAHSPSRRREFPQESRDDALMLRFLISIAGSRILTFAVFLHEGGSVERL